MTKDVGINNTVNVGDILTMDGQYKRRTFWQWLRNEPRELQRFVVKATGSSCSEYTPYDLSPEGQADIKANTIPVCKQGEGECIQTGKGVGKQEPEEPHWLFKQYFNADGSVIDREQKPRYNEETQ